MTAGTRPDTPPVAPARAFRKRPVTIEAVQHDGTYELGRRIAIWANSTPNAAGVTVVDTVTLYEDHNLPEGQWMLGVQTASGPTAAAPGYWIIRGVDGEFYPCPPAVFEATYEPADALESRECADPECAYFGQPHVGVFPHAHTDELRGRGSLAFDVDRDALRCVVLDIAADPGARTSDEWVDRILATLGSDR